MNYSIENINGVGQMTFTQAVDIRTNIWLSLHIPYGKWFADPTFGCKLNQINKITQNNILLAQQYIEQALAWLLQVGRAVSIIVVCEQDTQDPTRLDIKISATQPDGLLIKYQEFRPVGLSTSSDYTIHNSIVV
jgi:phage gp46-like protein